MRPHRRLVRRLASASVIGVLSLSVVSACGGDDKGVAGNTKADEDGDGQASPTEVLALAKKQLDETSGVELSLTTDDDPDTDAFLRGATGTIIADPPAFEGTADGRFQGFNATDIAVVSVNDTFWIDVPIQGFTKFDPADLCAPDPAQLLDPDTGVSSVLTSATDLEEGDTERGGPDNAEVLTVYTGTVPGDAVTNILPCAPGDEFEAKFTINDDGQLRAAAMTGEFFGGGGDITYTVDIEKYDVEKKISAP